jgi:hypothetical protein
MGEPWVKVRDGKHRLSQLINDEESGVSSWPEEVWIAKLASVMSSVLPCFLLEIGNAQVFFWYLPLSF